MQMNYSTYLSQVFIPEQTLVVGVTGQAGAGKTTLATRLVRESLELKIPTFELSLDWFFKLSSAGRKAWLAEGKVLGEQEYAMRANQLSWWDYEKLKCAIDSLLSGKALELTGVYNRQDKGELTRSVYIPQESSGRIIVLEGVGIAHLNNIFNGDLIYVYADSCVRMSRLLERDAARRVGKEAEARFLLTEAFEKSYFQEHGHRASKFVDNSTSCPVWVDYGHVVRNGR